MGKYTNVEARPQSIRIRFKYLGEWCPETIKTDPTLKNQKIASERLASINEKIRNNTFNYFDEFPGSRNIEKLGLYLRETKLFGEVAHDYIASISSLSIGTIKTYRKSLNLYWLPIWGGVPIDEIKYSEIAKQVAAIPWANPKTRNNNLTPLRGVFDTAWRDEIIDTDPCQRIGNQKLQKDLPDPFDKDEANAIIHDIWKHYDPAIYNYFEFAFFSGLRIEELIAIEWGDVDFKKCTITIVRARTSGHTKAVKGYKARVVQLIPRAMAALIRQKEHMEAIDAKLVLHDCVIFLNPETGQQWNDNGKPQRIRYWNPTIARLGIRHRPPKYTRHTYATMMLMSEVKTAVACEQMGHSPIVFQTVYSKWISSAEDLTEMEKLQQFVGE